MYEPLFNEKAEHKIVPIIFTVSLGGVRGVHVHSN